MKRINFGKILLFFIAAVLCCGSFGVYGADFTGIEVGNDILSGEVEVSGTIDDVYFLSFCITDTNVSGVTYTETMLETRTYAIGQTITDLNGKFSYRLKMPASLETGTYRVFIYADDRQGIYRDFAYSNYKNAVSSFEYLNKETNVERLSSYIKENINTLKSELLFDDYFYAGFTGQQKEKAAEMFISARPESGFQTLEQMRNYFNTQCISIFCQAETDWDKIDRAIREKGSLYGDISLYAAADRETRYAVCARLHSTYVSAAEFFDYLASETVVQSFKCAKVWNTYPELISRFQKYFPLSDWQKTEFSSLSNSDINELYINMFSSKNSYNNCGDIFSAYVSEIERLYSKRGPSNTSSGGGGGGGGGSTGGRSPGIADFAVSGEKNFGHSPDGSAETTESSVFHDIGDALWAQEYIMELYHRGIVSGAGDGCFYPNDSVKREEFVKMLALSFGLEKSADIPFLDVADDAWYKDYVALAYGEGVVYGVSENQFGTGGLLTREDLAVMVYRVMSERNIVFQENQIVFSDEAKISPYAKEAVENMCGLGIINGMPDGTFRPGDYATRAETSKILSIALSAIRE